jgi:hypothetical protein
MRLGIIDLDTSHPENWIPIERQLGCDIVGLFDGGSIHPRSYVEQFAKRFEIPRVYDNLDSMARDVDGVVIHGCDWDTHIAKATPFIKRNKSVLLDKPLAGNVADLQQINQWAQQGARITGGSSLRFCQEIRDYFAQPVEKRGTPHTVICGCAVDDFNYGIHAYSLLSGILGAGIQNVRHLGAGPQRRIQINWSDGRMGLLVIGKSATWLPFYVTIVTERTVTQIQIDAARLYRSMLDATLPWLAGETAKSSVSMQDLIESELAALAALRSWKNADAIVPIASLSPADTGYDGAAFAAEYRAGKYPSAKP